MMWIQALILAMVAAGGLGVVLTRDPLNQAVVASFYGILLGLMFFLFHAPDVALSQIVIGALALPLMILLALAKIRKCEQDKHDAEEQGRQEPAESGQRR